MEIGRRAGQVLDIAKLFEDERSTARRYEALLQTVNALVWELDAETLEISFITRQSEDMLGYAPSAWEHEPGLLARVIHPDDRVAFTTQVRDAVRRGDDHEVEYRAVRAGGDVV